MTALLGGLGAGLGSSLINDLFGTSNTSGNIPFSPVNIGAITNFAHQQGANKLINRYAQLGIPNSTGLSYDLAGNDLAAAAEYAQLAMAQNAQILQANAQQDQLASQLAQAQQQLAGLQGGNAGQNAGGNLGTNPSAADPFVVGGGNQPGGSASTGTSITV